MKMIQDCDIQSDLGSGGDDSECDAKGHEERQLIEECIDEISETESDIDQCEMDCADE